MKTRSMMSGSLLVGRCPKGRSNRDHESSALPKRVNTRRGEGEGGGVSNYGGVPFC